MNFRKHFELEGKHAFLGASSYHWLNYDDQKLIQTFENNLAKERGTRLHELACQMIKLKVKAEHSKQTFSMYVNDAIGFELTPEQVLYYSDYCFGTADAIGLKKNILRIHDLKTGETPAHMDQLYIYAALFCLEYGYKPSDFKKIECRIYQNDDILIANPTSEIIVPIMDKIVHADKILRDKDLQEGGM